jgi:hypothetical protein
MTQTIAARTHGTTTCDRQLGVTRSLLGWGVVAGPLYVAVWLAQAVTRDGFDLQRHPASVLANGDLGWIQIANFLVTGLMVVALAVGVGRAVRSGCGRRWTPRLIAAFGVGLVVAGIFRADPADGFPPGTPSGPAATMSWHAGLHYTFASAGFVALILACFVLGRRFAALGQPRWVAFSVTTGVVFLAVLIAAASGLTGATANVLRLSVAIILAWSWLAAVSAHLMTDATYERHLPAASTTREGKLS